MNKKVALVLSGGGARGIAHIGVIEELEKRDYTITSIAGTSMGSVVGGVYAMGKMEEFKEWLFTLDKMKVANLLDFSFGSPGLIKGDRVLRRMMEFIPDRNIEDLPIPYAAVATDIISQEEVVFTTGSVYKAIRASIAIPAVITPVKTKTGILVDGGVINNIPVNRVTRHNGDILIAVNVNANIPLPKKSVTKKEEEVSQSVYQKKLAGFYQQLQKINPIQHEEKMGYLDVITKTMGMMTYARDKTSLEKANVDILINISQNIGGPFDFYKAEQMAEAGREAAVLELGE